jgi:cation-transporting ATPase 13A3/4/5
MLVPLIATSLAQAKPMATLAPRRPTARLLGLETFATVVGICMINFAWMVGAFFLLFQQDFFLCNEWDASKIDLSKWWLLADNFEGCMIGLLVMAQVINAGAVGNFSAGYRQNWLMNWTFILVFTAAFTLVSCLILLDPNPVGCYFRFNCGDPETLVALGYLDSAEGVDWTGPKYNNLIGHNVLPPYFRVIVWVYMVGNLAAVLVWVRFVVIGPIRTFLRDSYGKASKQVKTL